MSYLYDLKYTLRLLRKAPGFTLLTILVLAGGLATSVYTYAVLNTMLFKDLPLPDGASVVRIVGDKRDRVVPLEAYELAQIRGAARSVTEIGVYDSSRSLLGDQDGARSVKTTYVEWGVFDFTRTKPALGRGFVQGDTEVGSEAVAVISHKLWQAFFSGDPGVVGKIVRINNRQTSVVGVMPEGYEFPVSVEMWLPLSSAEINPVGYTGRIFDAYGRLAPGASLQETKVELTALLRRIQRERADANRESFDEAYAETFQLAQAGEGGTYVFAVLNVVSAFILLLACVNVGNMLLARANDRIQETSLRVALGARRARLITQMSLESVVICAVGGLLGLGLTALALRGTNVFMNSALEGDLPYWWAWGLDRPAVVATAVFTLVTVLLVGILPTVSVTTVNPASLLRDGTRAGMGGRFAGKLSQMLVTTEIVLVSVVTLAGGAITTIANRAVTVDIGMDTRNLFTMPVELAGVSYDTPEAQLSFYERFLAALRNTGEFEVATIIQELGETEYARDGVDYTVDDYSRATLVVTSETPVTIGTDVIEGRFFDGRDTPTSAKTVIVSESFARAQWPGTSALNRQIRLVGRDNKLQEPRAVVGVVRDIRRGDPFATNASSYSALYVPLPQFVLPAASVVVRYRGSQETVRTSIYAALQQVDEYLPPGRIMSYEEVVEQLGRVASTMTRLFVVCGSFAILLAMTGIYGLSTNAIVRRTQEIGLRRAMGADNGRIFMLFFKRSSRQLAAGLIISFLASAAILFAISKFAGVGAFAVTIIGAVVTVAITALMVIATYTSVRRAVRSEPNVTLRYG